MTLKRYCLADSEERVIRHLAEDEGNADLETAVDNIVPLTQNGYIETLMSNVMVFEQGVGSFGR